MYGVGGTLRAVAFDINRLEVAGAPVPVPVLEQVMTSTVGATEMAFAGNGTMIYVSGRAAANPVRSLVWVDRTGREEPILVAPRAYSSARISPDGTRVALDIFDQANDPGSRS